MTTLTRRIVDSLMTQNKQQAAKLFEAAVAKNISAKIQDLKMATASTLYEGSDAQPVLQKRPFTIEALDTNKRSERFPDGEPIKYLTKASYGPTQHYTNAVERGHKVVKILDADGRVVTDHAKFQHFYGDREPIMEGLDKAYADWQTDVAKSYPEHTSKLRFVSKLDNPHHISAEVSGQDRSFGVFDRTTGKGQVLSEDTYTGAIDTQLTAQKKAEDAARAADASSQKSPTLNDVMSVLGNTVSVADSKVA